jgi:hypothetical protein
MSASTMSAPQINYDEDNFIVGLTCENSFNNITNITTTDPPLYDMDILFHYDALLSDLDNIENSLRGLEEIMLLTLAGQTSLNSTVTECDDILASAFHNERRKRRLNSGLVTSWDYFLGVKTSPSSQKRATSESKFSSL